MPSVLSPTQVDQYHRDGFLVVPDAVPVERCAALRDAAVGIVDRFEPSARRTVFTTNEQQRASNDEFLSSASGAWCFFEEGALGPDGEMRQPKQLSINKIGHAMHDLDPVFEAFTYTPELAGVATDIETFLSADELR